MRPLLEALVASLRGNLYPKYGRAQDLATTRKTEGSKQTLVATSTLCNQNLQNVMYNKTCKMSRTNVARKLLVTNAKMDAALTDERESCS